MIRRAKRFLVRAAGTSKEVGAALFGIEDAEGAGLAAGKVAGFSARRLAYVVADYWLMGISAALVISLKALGHEFALIFLALWSFDLVVAASFLVLWDRTGIDLTLGEDFRRAANVIHGKSPVAGYLTFAVVIAQATFWSGPEQVAIFFRQEIGSRHRMAIVLIALTAMQAALWAAVYSLGYESASELADYLRRTLFGR